MTRPRNHAAQFEYLLANQHRIEKRVLMPFLSLYKLNPGPRRILWPELAALFFVSGQSYVSEMLGVMRKCGLVEYEAGTPGDAGYLFFRVGV